MNTIRCSSLDRVLLCPGSLTLVPMVAPRKGDEGAEGTSLHSLAHARMCSELGALGDPGQPGDANLSFSKWVADYYFRFVQETAPADWSLQVETALAYDFDRFTLSGHIDALAMNTAGNEAIIFDLKTGYDPVDPADNNEQMFGYACLLLRAYPALAKVSAYIIQPRNDEDEGYQRISAPMVLEGATLENALPTLERRINACLDDSRAVDDGPRACLWCPAALQCPATIKRRELMKMNLTDEHLAAIKATPDDATLASWVIAGRILGRPLDDAKDMAKERIAATGSISDGETTITAKTGPGAYKYPDPVAYIKALRMLLPNDEDLGRAVNPSISKAVEVIADVHGLPKTSKVGNSATAIVNGHLKPLAVQGERTTLQFT